METPHKERVPQRLHSFECPSQHNPAISEKEDVVWEKAVGILQIESLVGCVDLVQTLNQMVVTIVQAVEDSLHI